MTNCESVLDWSHEIEEQVVYLEGTPRLKLVILTRKGDKLTNARNVILWHQGLGEHSGRVKHVAGELLSRCSPSTLQAFCTADIRGHGGSGGARGAIDGCSELERDLIERVIPAISDRCADDMRLVLCGHSLGGLVSAGVANRKDVVRELGKGQQHVAGVFLSAPAIEPVVHGVVNRVLAPLAHLIAVIPFMRKVTKANDISGTLISHDEKVVALYNGGDSELCNQVSFGLASSLLSRGNEILRDLTKRDESTSVLRSNIPVLIIHGEKDNLTRPEGSKRLAEAIVNEVDVVICPNALHELQNETKDNGRTLFYDRLIVFIERVCSE